MQKDLAFWIEVVRFKVYRHQIVAYNYCLHWGVGNAWLKS